MKFAVHKSLFHPMHTERNGIYHLIESGNNNNGEKPHKYRVSSSCSQEKKQSVR